MSGRGSGGGPSRGAGGPTQTTWARDGVGAILVVLAVGLAFRLFIVKVYGGTGLEFDLASFRGWADNLASQGLNGFYQRDFFHDYTPGYLYVLYGVGLLSQALNGGAGHIGELIKLPPILADVAIGWLVWSMAIELGASRRAALVGAAIAVANPVSWFDSVTWGQVDSFGVVFLLLGLREHPAPRARVRQRPDQQVRVLPLPPRRRRIRQLDPVPLGLLARRVRDHRELLRHPRRRAVIAPRPQPPPAQSPRERRVRPLIAQIGDLVEQRRGPQVRVITEPDPAVRPERREPVRARGRPLPRFPLPRQVRPDRLPVSSQVPGDRRHRPSSFPQRMRFH